MSMSVGTGQPSADINVTPLIDIVLVLLIIFMVLTPMVQRAYDMSIPEKAQDPTTPPPATTEQLVVTMTPDGRILLNKEQTQPEAVRTRLEELLRGRSQKIVFFQADDNVVYQDAVTTMDSIRAAGGTIGLVTTELAPAQ